MRGSLDKLLYGEKKCYINIQKKLHFIQGIACAIGHLHSNMISIIHRDIAARNVLVTKDWTVKITDFGLSRYLPKFKRTVTIKKLVSNSTRCETGPLKWMPPEAIKSQEYSRASDVYMFGITCWEILHESVPYKGEDPIMTGFAVIKDDLRPTPKIPVVGLRPLVGNAYSEGVD
jgi:serine/threonine protein kinase